MAPFPRCGCCWGCSGLNEDEHWLRPDRLWSPCASSEPCCHVVAEEDDLAPRDLDDILGFKTPTDSTRYDRFGRERERSGIAPGEDLAPDAWRPAAAPRRNY